MPRNGSFIFLALCMLVALLTVLFAGERKQKTLQVGSKKSLATQALQFTEADIAAYLNSTKSSLTAGQKVKALTLHFRANKQVSEPIDRVSLKQRAKAAKANQVRVSKETHR